MKYVLAHHITISNTCCPKLYWKPWKLAYAWHSTVTPHSIIRMSFRTRQFRLVHSPIMATFTQYRRDIRSGAKKHLFDTECTIFRSWPKQHLSVAIIPLKIAFLKGTDTSFSTLLRKAIWCKCKRSLKCNKIDQRSTRVKTRKLLQMQTSCNKVVVKPISGCVRTACSQLL